MTKSECIQEFQHWRTAVKNYQPGDLVEQQTALEYQESYRWAANQDNIGLLPFDPDALRMLWIKKAKPKLPANVFVDGVEVGLTCQWLFVQALKPCTVKIVPRNGGAEKELSFTPMIDGFLYIDVALDGTPILYDRERDQDQNLVPLPFTEANIKKVLGSEKL